MRRIRVLDSHTGGEPTRLVLDGFPDLGCASMAERRALLAGQHDAWRAATVLEPRGNDVIVGALLCPPVDPASAAGVIFFNNTGYLAMCGHGTIGATLHEDGSVSVRNVPAYRLHRQLALQVPGQRSVVGDVAWGGNWFFLVAEHGQRVASDNLPALSHYTSAIRQALQTQGIRGDDGGAIDHIELFADDDRADSRNFVLCPGGAYDRPPCGTGTSAKLACLAADGKLQPGQIWRQASIIGSQFEASYALADDQPRHGRAQIIPTLRGRAHMSAEATLLIEDSDPFGWGIRP